MKTFFEIVDEIGQAEMARQIDEHKATVNRCYHAAYPVNERVIAKCEEVFGAGFDAARTLSDWYARRRGGDEMIAGTSVDRQRGDGAA